MKFIKWIVLAVVLVVLISLVLTYLSLNGIIRSTVVSQSQKQLDVMASLGAARLSLVGGWLSLDDYALGSPDGFTAKHLLTLGRASVEVDYGQLRATPIHIKAVNLDNPTLTIEQAGGKLNFKVLMDQLPPSDPNSQLSVIIDELTVRNPQVVLRPGLPGLSDEIKIPLPTLTMKEIGSGEGNKNGAALKDVVMEVVNGMAAKASDSDKLPKELKTLLSLNVDEVKQKLGERANEEVKKVTDALNKKLGEQAGGAVNDAVKKVTGGKDAGQVIEQGIQGILKPEEKK